MKRRFLSYFILLGLVLSAFGTYAQLAAVPYEVDITVHYGATAPENVDLTGYVTYDVYLRTVDNNTRIVVINGSTPDAEAALDALGADGVLTPDALDLFINTPCGTFQHENAGWTVTQNQCAIQGFLPSMAWDSFVTLKYLCSPSPTSIQSVLFPPQDQNAVAAWENDNTGSHFDGGTQLLLDNGGWFGLPADQSTIPINNRVLVMRITTCGDMDGCFNVVYYPDYQFGDSPLTERICVQATHPCIGFPMDTTPSTGNVNCFGDVATVSLEDGGFGPVDYKIYNGNTVGTGSLVSTITDGDDGLFYSGLEPGNYYITMIDSVGCRDTSSVFTISSPAELIFGAEKLSDVNCFGDLTGSIAISCNGGTGTLDVTVNGQAGFNCGETIQGLGCGTYDIEVTDANGCTADTTIQISCPPNLVLALNSTNILCYGYDNGTITGTVSGGTGVKVVELVLNNEVVQTQNGTGTVIVNFANLDSGVYTVNVEDDNGCTRTSTFTITEPAEFIVTASATDVLCFGQCNGVESHTIVGGNGVASEQVVPQGGGPAVNASALCVGDYTTRITDNSGCIATADFTVSGPDDISWVLESTDLSCFGSDDGTITLTEVAGAQDGFTYDINPAQGNCAAPCAGNSVHYTELPAGVYTITITDQTGCTKDVNGISIGSPAEIVVELNTLNVTCNGAGDGIIQVDATGGNGELRLMPDDVALPVEISALTPGDYVVTIVDANGCTQDANATITEPDVLVATATVSNTVSCGSACDGSVEYIIEGGTGPFGYRLTSQSPLLLADGTIADLCTGLYNALIVDFNLCTDTLDFEILDPAPLTIDLNLDRPTCTGMTNGSAQITVSGGTGSLTTTFTPLSELNLTQSNDTTFSISQLAEQTFVIELVDSIGCVRVDTVEVIPDIITDMVITMFSSPETCWDAKDGSATCAVQNGFLPLDFLWTDPYEQVTPTAVGLLGNQPYLCTVTDAIGCTLTDTVFVETTEGCFFIANMITPNGDGVNDYWVLGGLEFYPEAKITVFNRWGQKVYDATGYAAPWYGVYDGEQLPVADYYYVIDYSDEFEPITGTVTIKY